MIVRQYLLQAVLFQNKLESGLDCEKSGYVRLYHLDLGSNSLNPLRKIPLGQNASFNLKEKDDAMDKGLPSTIYPKLYKIFELCSGVHGLQICTKTPLFRTVVS